MEIEVVLVKLSYIAFISLIFLPISVACFIPVKSVFSNSKHKCGYRNWVDSNAKYKRMPPKQSRKKYIIMCRICSLVLVLLWATVMVMIVFDLR